MYAKRNQFILLYNETQGGLKDGKCRGNDKEQYMFWGGI